MFGLSRLLRLAGNISWRPRCGAGQRWVANRRQARRGTPLSFEELECRDVPAVGAGNSMVSFTTPTVPTGGTDPVTIVVRDTSGNVITGLSNSAFGLSLGGGTSTGGFGAVAETATQGTYVANITGASAGTASALTVTVSGVTLTTKPTLQVTSGSISADSGVSFATTTAPWGKPDMVTIAVKDAAGSPMIGLSAGAFLFALSGGTSVGSFGPALETTTLGTYTSIFTPSTVGTASTLTVTVIGRPITQAPMVTVVPGAVSSTVSTVHFATPTVVSAGTDLATLTVADGGGNAITGLASSALMFSLAGPSGGSFGPVSETATKGTYTTTFTATTAGTPSSLTATITGIALAAHPTIQVNPGPISSATSTVSFATATATSGLADTVTIAVKDSAGNAITGLSNATFSFTLGGGTSTGSFGTVTESATKGTYTAAFTGAKAGTAITLTMKVSGVTLAATPTVTVAAGQVSGALTTVSFATPSVASGVPDVVTLAVADSAGNIISGLPSSAFTFSLAGGASLGSFSAAAETATKGTYKATFTPSTAGSASTLTTLVQGVTLAAKPSITVTPGAVSKTNSTVSFGLPIVGLGNVDTVTVVVSDAAGNPISGLTNSAFAIALAGGTSAGTFGTVTETAVKGCYTANFTSTKIGTTSTLTATVSGIALANQATITVTIGPSGTIATNMPTFSWSAVSGATSYKIWLTDQTTGQSTVFANLTGTQWTSTQALAMGDSYIWWAGAVLGQSVSWSSPLHFRIAPTGSGPSGALATNVPVFSWNSVIGASSYKIWLIDNATAQTTVISTLTGVSWTPATPLTLGDNYTWWVGAVQGQTVAWSSALSFKIAPTGSGPSGTIATNVPVFGWNNVIGAASFEIWLTDNTTGQSSLVPNLSGTSWSPSQALTLGDNYTWWVGAVQGLTVAWSSALSFRIAPTASAPGGTIVTTLPTFLWNKVIGAASYEVWLIDQTWNQPTVVANLTGTSWVPTKALTVGDKYAWWIGAVTSSGLLDWGAPLYFTVS